MQRIYERVEYLLNQNITVWMYYGSEGEKITLRSIEKKENGFYCESWEGKRLEMSDDEENYETVNYSAPLFH